MKSEKSVLVVDTPQCCFECHYCHFYGKYGYRKCLLSKEFVDVQDDTIDILKERHKCCPLRPFLLGEELRKFRGTIKDKKTLIGFNMAIAICNKYLGETE